MKIKLVKSTIGYPERVRGTVKALGFKRCGQTIEVKEDDCVKGMVRKVQHLVSIVK